MSEVFFVQGFVALPPSKVCPETTIPQRTVPAAEFFDELPEVFGALLEDFP
jgi:hypothetical protein|tara:strand:+ start:316 stop:468 length:153 start_codon:yes stop_codon:yes gene_type:complete